FRILHPIDAGRAMTIRAALCSECFGAGLHAGKSVDGGWGAILRMALARCRADIAQPPTDDRRILDGSSDIIKAAKEEYRRADADNYRKHANHRKDTHLRLQCAVSNYRRQTDIARYPVCVTLL